MSFSANYPTTAPSLLLDFSNSNTVDPRVTFTRASTATYFNSIGSLTTAAINSPRLDYDPTTLASQGLLIEEQRTNLLTYSEQFDNASGWTSARASVTANATTAPTGTSVADKIVEDTTATNTHLTFSANVTVATATVYTYSVYAKAAGRTWFNMQIESGAGAYGATVPFCYFNLSGVGAVGSLGSATGSITSVGNGWYRCVVVAIATTSASTTNMRIKLATTDGVDTYTGDGASGIFVFGAQLEAGAFPTSYIPTSTAAVTRSADVASVNTLSPWYNAVEGTLYVEWQSNPTSYARYLVSIEQAASQATRIDININAGNTVNPRTVVSGAAVATLTGGTYAAGTVAKGAFGYKSADYASSLNGAAAVTATTAGALPSSLATMYLGSITGTTQTNGYIRRIVYYPIRLSNANLQAITS